MVVVDLVYSGPRNKLNYANNASKLHKSFGDMLLDEGFSSHYIEQEVIVKQLCPNHSNGRDRFDYYLPSFKCVIELHGAQHRQAVDFGGEGLAKAKRNLVVRLEKDIEKQMSALAAGIPFIEIWHTEELTWKLFEEKLHAARKHPDLASHKPKEKQSTFKNNPDKKMTSKSGFTKTTRKMGEKWE